MASPTSGIRKSQAGILIASDVAAATGKIKFKALHAFGSSRNLATISAMAEARSRTKETEPSSGQVTITALATTSCVRPVLIANCKAFWLSDVDTFTPLVFLLVGAREREWHRTRPSTQLSCGFRRAVAAQES